MKKPAPFQTLPLPAAPRPRSPANDQASATPSVAAFAWALTDPLLGAHLESRLGPLRIPRADKEDLAAAVKESLWRRRDDADPACEMPRMLALANRVLDARLVDYWRRRAARRAVFAQAPRAGEADAEPGDAHEDPPSPLDRLPAPAPSTPERDALARGKLAFVVAIAPALGMTDDDVEALADTGLDANVSWEELAAERGTTPHALRMRISRLRGRLNDAWEGYVARRIPPRSRALAEGMSIPCSFSGGRATYPVGGSGSNRRGPRAIENRRRTIEGRRRSIDRRRGSIRDERR